MQEELDHRLGLAREHVLGQEVGDVPAGAGEAVDEGLRIGAIAQRQRGQVHAGRPALRALDQARDERGRQPHAGGGEQGARLVGAERQLGRPQLGELPVRAQGCERQRRVRARAERELAPLRQPLAEVLDQRVAAPLGHEVEVVEDQDERLPAAHTGVDERRQHELLERPPGR